MSPDEELEGLHRSDQRVVRTVDSLTDEQWAGSSLLPGWTRAHVVAHLALNAEAFAGALEALAEGEVRPIYPSQESRDAAIEELAAAPYGDIRERFFAATQHFRTVAGQLDDEHWAGTVLRLPGGPAWPAADLITARRREVEIHHADLGMAYTHRTWPQDFVVTLIDAMAGNHADSPDSPGFSVRATDLARTWSVGAEVPVVEGFATDLGWWLVGRGHGEGLRSSSGPLPVLGSWQRAR